MLSLSFVVAGLAFLCVCLTKAVLRLNDRTAALETRLAAKSAANRVDIAPVFDAAERLLAEIGTLKAKCPLPPARTFNLDPGGK